MGIPLGIFAVAFSTILLPHFTRMKMEQPEKLNFYLFESIKFILWITIPAALIMSYLSTDIFQKIECTRYFEDFFAHSLTRKI